MKLINTDMDTLFFSGQMKPLVTQEGKQLNQVGLTVTLGERLHADSPNQFTVSGGDNNGSNLVDLNLVKAEFTIKDNLTTPTLEYTKRKRKDQNNFLVTGTTWTNMTGLPNVEGLLLEDKHAIFGVYIIAQGVNRPQTNGVIYHNALLLVPTNSHYCLGGKFYRVEDDKEVAHKPDGIYMDLKEIL